ncbi:Fe-S cluster assembly sulfur transfer protein SufU [Lignipirellula cremea]|uniref:NifU-like protein n=1 Tax=Lignipirellula cremea TaxID=2528010 RepID=A0A518DWE5_9BACT|nr:SUF system NifU family Fe-S cluster assembly protein [Lignipirellula cremea]QDU96162.1 NifU-like protein [Lignipirellula cremea]
MPFSKEEEIYQEHILEHYEDPFHRGECTDATHADEGKNPLCGDKVRIELRVNPDGVIEEAWFEGKGCIISQASASMLLEEIEGKTVEDAKAFTTNQMLDLFGAKLTPNRQKCCLLSWRILQSAVYSPVGGEGGVEQESYSGPHSGEES